MAEDRASAADVRPLAYADIDALAAALASHPVLRRRSATLAAELRSAASRGDGLLVFDDGRVSGLAWFNDAGTLGLGGCVRVLAVDAAAQGRGIGSVLLAEAERQVARASRHAFTLLGADNEKAHRFVEAHGYARVGALPGAIVADVDELIYWKRLTAISGR